MRTIKQKNEFDCGVASAAMLLEISYETAARLCQKIFIYEKGINHAPLIARLREQGLTVSGLKRGSVVSTDMDALVHVWLEKSGSHWVVWDGKHQKFRDPSDETEKFECRSHYLIERR